MFNNDQAYYKRVNGSHYRKVQRQKQNSSFSLSNISCKQFTRNKITQNRIPFRPKSYVNNKKHPLQYLKQKYTTPNAKITTNLLNSNNQRKYLDYSRSYSSSININQSRQKEQKNQQIIKNRNIDHSLTAKRKTLTYSKSLIIEKIKSNAPKQTNHSFYSFDSRSKKTQKRKQCEKQLLKNKLAIHYRSLSQYSNQKYQSENSMNILNKNHQKHKINRLDKIMSIKVQKPDVCSTLKNYKPLLKQRKQKDIHRIKNTKIKWQLEFLQSLKEEKRKRNYQQKENILWRNFERQRGKRYSEKIKTQELQYEDERRMQRKFQQMVSKQIGKIKSQRQIQQRQNHGFSEYLYPFH